MAPVTAIKTDLRNEIIRTLQQDITYQVQADDVGGNLLPDAILYQKTRAQMNRSFMTSNQETAIPGLIVCEPLRTFIDPSEGTMNEDIWHYPFLIQLIDKEAWDDTNRIATWDKWIEQITSAFMFSGLNGVVVRPKGEIWTSVATPVSSIDERNWVRESQFILGVEIKVRVSQPRGIIA